MQSKQKLIGELAARDVRASGEDKLAPVDVEALRAATLEAKHKKQLEVATSAIEALREKVA